MPGPFFIGDIMLTGNPKIVILARLKPKPLLAGQLLCALLFAGLAVRQAQGESVAEVIRHILFGNLAATILIAVAALGLAHHVRLWRQRGTYIFHDGTRLYRGSEASWPLAAVRDVVVARGGFGIDTLRLVVDDDSETTRELVKLYMLADPPEGVRGGVMFAAARTGGTMRPVTVH